VFRAAGVEKSFRSKQVLRGATLAVEAGESIALIGENGAGKSTFMSICAGVVTPDAGSIEVNGRLGWCPQHSGLVDLLSADEHIALMAEGVADPEAGRRRVYDLLEVLGFDRSDRTISRELSGGQRQKLNLALTILDDPQLLLLDEPYQGFDHGTYVNLWDQIERWTDEGRAVIVITHLLAERSRVSRVAEVSAGRIVEIN